MRRRSHDIGENSDLPVNDQVLPRYQQGARSQQLLTVLLGDYWHLRSQPIPSAALVELLGTFGITAPGARAAIQRLAQRGFFVALRDGRTTAYAVRPMSQEAIDTHVRLLFDSHQQEPWDHTWTLVAFSLPEASRNIRHVLRELLRRHKFGNLYDGLWVRPGDSLAEVDAIRRELGDGLQPDQLTAFIGARLPSVDSAAEAVSAAFGVEELANSYRAFSDRWRAFGELPVKDPPSLQQADFDRQDDALRTRTSIMREWRELRHADPMLPVEVLALSSPLDEALRVCTAVYDPLGPLAEAAFRRRLQPYGEELASVASHHTFAGSTRLPT